MSNLTLFNLTYMVARELGVVNEGTATGGTTATIVDATYRTEADNFWAGGSAWIIRDAAGAGAAPEGEYAICSSSTSSTGTLTFPASSFTVAPATGDRYAVCRKAGENPWLNIIIQKVNQALMDMGPVVITDTTSITTAANQTEYSLPVAANMDLRQVWMQTITTDSNDNQWMQMYNWRVQKSGTAGTADTLILAEQPPSGYDLKLVYMSMHPEMYTSTSQLNESVPQELVIYPAVRDCYLYLKQSTGWDKWDDMVQQWTERVEAIRGRVFVQKPKRAPKLMIPRSGLMSDDREFDGTVRINAWE